MQFNSLVLLAGVLASLSRADPVAEPQSPEYVPMNMHLLSYSTITDESRLTDNPHQQSKP